ncbi:hypothetical protein PF005_g8230 [Phytophthora fragariae]|uniref:Uncharacterized protein n=1 Tax=Phytophthora fragariae TaxID=53985 RepID=A0A6A3ZT13_9STRA|nr:hypothetical protein PF003_g7790 [Phytophthora fragariae]KAE8940575.1 hypothetical protein PF009_g9605 [Phytophthora fragariae]KAE9117417.1 hypothetical protein PF007_g9287 [Phytophthora fragariae]KAE9119615.1 hypothetical protein PF010_g7789 [Phytophthora fragariae]KAE9146889.1 hypothetical protein PF006_g8379 [Phytophthora fragariae]
MGPILGVLVEPSVALAFVALFDKDPSTGGCFPPTSRCASKSLTC